MSKTWKLGFLRRAEIRTLLNLGQHSPKGTQSRISSSLGHPLPAAKIARLSHSIKWSTDFHGECLYTKAGAGLGGETNEDSSKRNLIFDNSVETTAETSHRANG